MMVLQKRKIMAKVLSVLLSLALLMALFSSSAFSEDKSDSISAADESYEVEATLDETAIVSDESLATTDDTALTDSSIQNTSSYVSSASALSKTTSFVLDSLESSESQILGASSDATATTEYLVAANTTENTSIYTAQDLYDFAEKVNAGQSYEGLTVTLENDIDLSTLDDDWIPIGTRTNSFSGTFDGGGYTISGLSITRDEWDETQMYIGLFGYINGASIQNITVDGNITLTSNFLSDRTASYYANAGGVVGFARESIISGCTNKVAMEVCTTASTGGIVGYTYYTNLSGCINQGTISLDIEYPIVALYTGGIAGFFELGDMENCANYADITVEGNQTEFGHLFFDTDTIVDYHTGYVGGLVGTFWASDFLNPGTNYYMSNCYNSGDITGDMLTAGGLVGRFAGNLVVQNSYNTGDITLTGNAGKTPNGVEYTWLAGLVTTSVSSGSTLTLENCYNLGTVRKLQDAFYDVVIRIDEITVKSSDVESSNVFTSDEMSNPENVATLVEESGRAFVYGVDGLPILAWVQAMLEAVDYTLVFSISPAEAQLKLYSDEDMNTLVEPISDTTFSVKYGIYYYEISAEGYITETGSLIISGQDVTKEVSLKKAATVIFSVSSAEAQDLDFFVTDSNGEVFTADNITSETDGYTKYTYTLYDEVLCYYSAYATGYDGITLPYVVNGNDDVVVELTLP